MSIQVLPQEGNFSSNFGAGLGSGLSQQLPEEIKRYRVKSGIENLGKQNIQDPYQLLAQISSLPIDAAEKNSLYSLLQSQIGAQQALAPFGSQPSNPSMGTGQGQPAGNQQPASQAQGNEPKLTPTGKGAPQIEPVNELANNLLRYQRLNYPTPQAANAEADRRLSKYESEFATQTAAFSQKDKDLLQGEVGGDVLDLMRQKGRQELARTGLSETSIAQKYARQAKEIGKEYSQLRKIYDGLGVISRPDQSTIKNIGSTAERLSNLGVPEDQIIDNTMATFDVGRGAAEYLINPLHDTRAGKALHSTKKLQFVTGAIEKFQGAERKLAEQIAPLITSDDLIGSLAYIAEQRGYNGQKFISELSQAIPQNIKDKLSTTQIRDLEDNQLIPKMPTLHQLWLFKRSGENARVRK